jgi:hypothetical protein
VVSKDLGATSTPIRWEELRNSSIRASSPACSTIPSPTLPDIKFGGLDSDFGPKPYSKLGPNISAIASSSTSPNAWYFDSGASDHITGDITVFDELIEVTPFAV